MTIGVGGSTAEKELAALKNMRGDVPAIGLEERLRRVDKATRLMREKGVDALWLDVSSSLTYFTGLKMRRTERAHGAILTAKGEIVYLSPAFEVEKLRTMMTFGDKIAQWEEDEDPTALIIDTVRSLGISKGTIGVDEATPFFTFDGLAARRQRLHLLERVGNYGRLPHGEVRSRVGADADGQEHHPRRAQGGRAYHARRHHDEPRCRPSSSRRTASWARKRPRRSTPSCSARRPPIRTACPTRRRSRMAT